MKVPYSGKMRLSRTEHTRITAFGERGERREGRFRTRRGSGKRKKKERRKREGKKQKRERERKRGNDSERTTD